MTPWIAFYAPMKSPTHPNPSGDRKIARLCLSAIEQAGWTPRLVSELRTRDGAGDETAQAVLFEAAEAESDRLIAKHAAAPPAAWFTYHCYYKAPDLVGPRCAKAFGAPYIVAEGARSPKRLHGPWAAFARASEAALDQAAAIFWMSRRDLPALQDGRPDRQRLIHLPPFLDIGPDTERRPCDGSLRLLTVAMMRRGDKLASYATLARALALTTCDWRLAIVGDGEAGEEVRRLFDGLGDRVAFHGAVTDPAEVTAHYAAAELFLWPGVGEAFGMAYLEAQAAGLPVIAEDREGVRDVMAPSASVTPPDRPDLYAAAIDDMANNRQSLRDRGDAARDHVRAHHSIAAAAALLRQTLNRLHA